MSFLRKAREFSGDVAAASKRQAQRGKLELELRRLDSKVSSEKDAIGHALFPLLEAGTLHVEVLEVHTHMKAIEDLLGEIGQRRAELEALVKPTSEEAVATSIKETDQNATMDASIEQSAADERANRSESPAEQGGQG